MSRRTAMVTALNLAIFHRQSPVSLPTLALQHCMTSILLLATDMTSFMTSQSYLLFFVYWRLRADVPYMGETSIPLPQESVGG